MAINHKTRIDDMMSKVKCEHNFACYYTPNGNICNAKDMGIDGFLTCLDKNADFCLHSLDFGDSKFCTCPMNNYIIKNGIKSLRCKSFYCRLMEFAEKLS